jgi:hypothetical protein
MKPDLYKIIEMAVSNGVAIGYRRAHKHNDNPNEDQIIDAIENAVMGQICGWVAIRGARTMTRDDHLLLLQECGFGSLMDHPIMTENMMRFAALVAAHEREACAKACEAEHFPVIEDEACEPYNMGCRHSAAAIRARGKT